MSDITLGQYFPGNSFIHKMDARMKIVLTVAVIVALFICKNFYTLALVTVFSVVIVLSSKYRLKRYLKVLSRLPLLSLSPQCSICFTGRASRW